MAKGNSDKLLGRMDEYVKNIIGGCTMKIVYSSSGVQQGRETENRDAAITNAASMIDYLCILEGVPTEDEAANTEEGMSNE